MIEIDPEITTTHAMQAWAKVAEPLAIVQKRDRQTLVRVALAELRNLKTSTGPLTNDQRDRALRRFAEILEAIIEEMSP